MAEERKHTSYIIANIAWNSSGWKGITDDRTNFRWTHIDGNIPHESWNFDFENIRNTTDKIFGYTQFTHPPKKSGIDNFFIIFRSRDQHGKNKIVGFYGDADILKEEKVFDEKSSANIIAKRKLCILLENAIEDSDNRFLFGKQKVGQIGFNLISKSNSIEILNEAVRLNTSQSADLNQIKFWLDSTLPSNENGKEKMARRYWVGRLTNDDYWEKAIDENLWYCQQRYGYQSTAAVSNFLSKAKEVSVNDVIFLAYGNGLYSYGVVRPCPFETNQIASLEKVISEKSYEYKTGIVKFTDNNAFYEDLRNGEECWGQRICVQKWLCYDENSTVNTYGIKDYILSGVVQESIFEVTKDYGEAKMKELENQALENRTLAEKLKDLLLHTHNLILHGAPGTGKTHLAREIAAEMKAEVGFVQFHPSYDYTDFVEGLRPVNDAGGGQIGFERKDGVFKNFCERALKNLEDSKKSVETSQDEKNLEYKINENDFTDAYYELLATIEIGGKIDDKISYSLKEDQIKFSTPSGNIEDRNIQKDKLEILFEYLIKNEEKIESLSNREEQKKVLGVSIDYTYYKPLLLEMLKSCRNKAGNKNEPSSKKVNKADSVRCKKNFVFIIDEINRGEMSKIFGELFFSIDPGYRGKDGLIQTQYQNLVPEGDIFSEGFYVPENVYIIGTMNDIDRNVESMDFAFRRRFTFKEIKAKDTEEQILSGLDNSIRDKAILRMDSLNDAISETEGLSSAYHIGGAYFLKLKDLTGTNDEKFAQLWEYHLEGLLREYLRGMEDADSKLAELRKAYENKAVANQDESSNGQ